MKFLKIFIVLIVVASFVSCSSDDDTTTNNDPGAQAGLLYANVDGSSFTSTEATTTAQIQSGVLAITGLNSNGDTISININNFDAEGSFDLSGSLNEGLAIYLPKGENTFYNSINAGGSGVITITSMNTQEKKISGTFNFTATRTTSNGTTETITINDGSFLNVTLTNL